MIIGIFQILASALLLGVVLWIDVLPLKYVLYLAGGILLLDIIFGFFLFRKKVKKKPKKIVSVLSILLTILFTLGSFYIYKTFGVIDNMVKEYEKLF